MCPQSQLLWLTIMHEALYQCWGGCWLWVSDRRPVQFPCIGWVPCYQGSLPVVGPQLPGQPLLRSGLGFCICLGHHTVREAEDLIQAAGTSLLLYFWASSHSSLSTRSWLCHLPAPRLSNHGSTGEGLMEDEGCWQRGRSARTC